MARQHEEWLLIVYQQHEDTLRHEPAMFASAVVRRRLNCSSLTDLYHLPLDDGVAKSVVANFSCCPFPPLTSLERHNPFKSAVLFCGQTSLILCRVYPKRGCTATRDNGETFVTDVVEHHSRACVFIYHSSLSVCGLVDMFLLRRASRCLV